MKEISFLKQQLNVYENNNSECNRKWQNLIEVKLKKIMNEIIYLIIGEHSKRRNYKKP